MMGPDEEPPRFKFMPLILSSLDLNGGKITAVQGDPKGDTMAWDGLAFGTDNGTIALYKSSHFKSSPIEPVNLPSPDFKYQDELKRPVLHIDFTPDGTWRHLKVTICYQHTMDVLILPADLSGGYLAKY